MKFEARFLWIPAALLGGVIGHAANAQEPTWFGQSADGRWLIGAKVGRVDKTTTGFSEETRKRASLRLGFPPVESVARYAALQSESGLSLQPPQPRFPKCRPQLHQAAVPARIEADRHKVQDPR